MLSKNEASELLRPCRTTAAYIVNASTTDQSTAEIVQNCCMAPMISQLFGSHVESRWNTINDKLAPKSESAMRKTSRKALLRSSAKLREEHRTD